MQINDRLLTVVTGVVLAIGGAAASLFLGEDHAQIDTPKAIVYASTSQLVLSDAMAAIEPAQRRRTKRIVADTACLRVRGDKSGVEKYDQRHESGP